MMTGTVCFEQKTSYYCNAKFGDLGLMGTGGQNMASKVPYLESPTLICLHYATFKGLRWWLRVVYSWVLPLLSIFH